MRKSVLALFALAALVLVPAAALAQASITGVVRDSSGAVLPGVTVEVSSDALIEKVRTAVTDGSGQYRIIDLRPGTYLVTFTLTGFSMVKRDGVELEGQLTATVNADLRVGALEETITVTGETPIVDVQSIRRQATITGDVVNSIPSSRAYGAIMQLIPSLISQASFTPGARDVQVTPGMSVFGGAGGRENEGRLQVDGINTGAPVNGAGVSSYIPDITNSQEVAFTTSGGLGEAEVGGPTMSIVQDGREFAQGDFLRRRRVEGDGRQQLHGGIARRRAERARAVAEALGLQPRRRRSGQARSPVVLRHLPRRRRLPIGAGHVRQPQRRRPGQVDLLKPIDF
jgi:hypothetical protein